MGSGSTLAPGCKKDEEREKITSRLEGFREVGRVNCNLLMGSLGIWGQH